MMLLPPNPLIRGNLIYLFLCLFLLFCGSMKSQTETIPILGFHDVINLNDPEQIPPNRRSFSMDYSLSKMEKLLRSLLEQNYYFLSADEFYDFYLSKNREIPQSIKTRKQIMLTFDDGYIGLYKNLLPLLHKLRKEYKQEIKVILFLNASLLGVESHDIQYIDCAQIREGFKDGFFDIQSHGYTHRNFTELSIKDLEFEARESQKFLQQCLEDKENKLIKHFAYPYGATNQEVQEIIKKYYLTGFVYNNQKYQVGSSTSLYNLPRVIMNSDK